MAGTPLVGTINAQRVVVAETIFGGVHGQQVTVLMLPSGQRIQRVFANVPAQGPPLVGRNQAFLDLQARVAEGGKLALHGLPGAGKSALALALAYDEATLKRFGGGVLWAGLGPQANVANILNLWGAALGVDVSTGFDGKPLRTAAERAQRLNAHLQAALGGQPFLLLLDDVWRWEDLLDFEYLATPGYAVVLTSRDAALARRFVDTPERVVRVQELDERAALDLLIRAAPEAGAAVPADLGDVARAVGYLPLALVLMGRELAAHAGQDRWIRQAVKRLRSATAQLDLAETARRPGLAGVPLSLQAVVRLSLDALPDDAIRSAFAELSVFATKPADFSREAALAVWQADDDRGDTHLRTLYDRGLLESTGQDRFTLHQVLAAVATNSLGARPELAERHCAYYVGFAKGDPEAWSPIEHELPQIHHAWEWAARTPGQDQWVLALVWALRLFMQRRGLYSLWYAWLDRSLEAARRLQQPRDEAAVLHNLGMLVGLIGHEAALDHYQRALDIRRRLSDRSGEAETLNNIGTLHLNYGGEKAALDHYQLALDIRRSLRDRSGEAQTLNNIGTLHLKRATGGWFRIDKNELDQAREFFEQALPIVREVRDRRGEGVVLNSTGVVHSHQGDQMAALDHYRRALAIRRDLGDLEAQVTTHYNIATSFEKAGDEGQALDHYQQALAIVRRLGNREGEATIRKTCSELAVRLGKTGRDHLNRRDDARALECFERALTIVRAANDQAGEATLLHDIGIVHSSRNDEAAALEYYQQALAAARAAGDLRGEAATLKDIRKVQHARGDRAGEVETLYNIGRAYRQGGHLEEALDYFGRTLPLAHALGNRTVLASTRHHVGRIFRAQGDPNAALQNYREALTLRHELGDRQGEADTLANMGVAYYDQGDLPVSLDYFQRSLVITREVNDRRGEATTLHNIGTSYAKGGDQVRALDHYQLALAAARSAGDQEQQARNLLAIADVHRARGDLNAAIGPLEDGVAILQATHSAHLEGPRRSLDALRNELQSRPPNATS